MLHTVPLTPTANLASTRTLLLATDLQRSILAELDRSGPNQLAYTAYGSQSSRLPTGAHLGFNGQLKEPSAGGYHLGNGHRMYNPVLMRFHSPDRLSPFGKGGLNAYAYCGADPINFEDPSGQFAIVARLIQLVETIGLHFGILSYNFVGPTAKGWLLQAARISTVGSSTAIAGSALQLGGVPAGAIVSNVGTLLSVGAVTVRVVTATTNHLRSGVFIQTVRNNARNLVSGTAFPKSTVDAVTKSGPAPGVAVINMPSDIAPAAEPKISASDIRNGGSGVKSGRHQQLPPRY